MRIGELAAVTGIKAETIRYYERENIISPPARAANNYRDYGTEHVSRLRFVRRARELGFPMKRVRKLLTLADDRNQSCAAVDALTRDQLDTIEEKIADLMALRTELRLSLVNCEQGTVGDCRIIEALGRF